MIIKTCVFNGYMFIHDIDEFKKSGAKNTGRESSVYHPEKEKSKRWPRNSLQIDQIQKQLKKGDFFTSRQCAHC